jgi:ferritin-like metal-binding protein YciE
MAGQKTLQDALHEGLKDVLFAERTSVRALKKAAKAAKMPDLKQALEQHAQESEAQKDRLEQVFEAIGKPARGKTCESIQGLMAELDDHMEEFKDSDAADAVLIAGTQAMEHYEIARYGTLKTWAGQLGLNDAVKLLEQTLEEERKADELLNQVAQKANQVGEQG